MSNKEIAALAKLCKKLSISWIKLEGVELTVDLQFANRELHTQEASSTPATADLSTPDVPSEEDILFWSSNTLV